MLKKIIVLAAVLAAVAVLDARIPASAQAQEANKPDAGAFARGARLWANNCGRCHNVRDPKELRDDQWKPVMTHMRIRAPLTGAEQRDILLFLQASN